jgi:4-hydroxy-4-methyl-2-oxoglutarate aldolase
MNSPDSTGPAAPQVAQAAGATARVLTGLTLLTGRPYLSGPAFTAACAPGDNLAVQAAVYQAPPGSVIVCHGGGTATAGLFGGLAAADAVAHGLAGLVIEGPVRDTADIDRLGFPVLSTGTAPARAAKEAIVSIGRPVIAGGVLVSPGDQVVADRDGAVVIPAADWPQVLAAARALAQREETVLARIAAGERLADINGLDLTPYLVRPGG